MLASCSLKISKLFGKAPTITVKGQQLQVVDKFTYLGSTLSSVVQIDDENNARSAKSSATFGQLRRSIWTQTQTLSES